MSVKRITISMILCVHLLAGCANTEQLEAIKTFAQGAQTLSEASNRFYNSVLETDRSLASMTVNLGSRDQEEQCKNKEGGYQTPWDCAVKGQLQTEVQRHRAALASLTNYALSLSEMADFDNDSHVATSANALANQLDAIAAPLKKSTDKKDSVLAQAITQLAKVYFDTQSAELIAQKTQQAQPYIENILTMLRDDLKRAQQRVMVNHANAQATREEWFNAYRFGYQSNLTNPIEKANLSISAGQLVRDELLDKQIKEENMFFFKQFNETINSCIEAHKAIQFIDSEDKLNVLIHFVDKSRALLTTVHQFNTINPSFLLK